MCCSERACLLHSKSQLAALLTGRLPCSPATGRYLRHGPSLMASLQNDRHAATVMHAVHIFI